MEPGLVSCTAEDSATKEDGMTEGGWLAVVGVRVAGDLVEAQKVESGEDGEEGQWEELLIAVSRK